MEGAIAKNINLGGKGLPVNKTESSMADNLTMLAWQQ